MGADPSPLELPDVLLCCLTCAASPPLLPLLLFKLLSFGSTITMLLFKLLPAAFTCCCVTSAPLAGFTSPRFGWYGWLPNTSGP